MVDLIKRFFSKKKGHDTIGDDNGATHDIRVAVCALFIEMANIDGKFSESEKGKIISILNDEYQLPKEYTDELMEGSLEELKGSIDLWQFTNRINRNYSIDEKIQIIEMIWKIAYSDGCLDKHEDYLVHKLANLLHLSHNQLIDTKLRVAKKNNPSSGPSSDRSAGCESDPLDMPQASGPD